MGAWKVFIAHAPSGERFVHDVLLPSLELRADEVVLQSALRLGGIAVREIERGVAEAAITILVLTRDFPATPLADLAESMATHHRLADAGVIPLVLEPYALPPRLEARVALDCSDASRFQPELERLYREVQTSRGTAGGVPSASVGRAEAAPASGRVSVAASPPSLPPGRRNLRIEIPPNSRRSGKS